MAENHSLTWALEGSAGALLLVAATGVLFPLRERLESEPDPLEEFDASPVALNLKPRSGPIVVKVEYRIPEKNLKLSWTSFTRAGMYRAALVLGTGRSCVTSRNLCNGQKRSARRPGRITFT